MEGTNVATATEGYVEAQTQRLKAEVQAENAEAGIRIVEAIRASDRARFRETMWLAGLVFAMVASAAGLIIAVLR